MKKLLDAYVPKLQPAGSSARPPRVTPSTSRVLEEKCIFCDKTSKYIKGQKTREEMVKCCELRADSRIRDAAVKKLDDIMLSITSRDRVAAEGHYHRSCYSSYTRGKPVASSGLADAEDNADDHYKTAETQAHEEHFSYIRSQLPPCQHIVPMATLRQRFEESMSCHGITIVTNSSRKNLRRKIENKLVESIHICPDDNGKLLVCTNSLSKGDLVKRTHALQVELDAMRAQSVALVAKAALLLRNEIKQN